MDNGTLGNTDLSAAFERLQASAPTLAKTSAAQRIERIRKLVAAMFARLDDIHIAVREELGLCDTDIDAQLMMVRAEADFIAKHLAAWMRPQTIQTSLFTLGKKCYVRHEPKGVVLNLATWNAPFAISFVPALGAVAAGCPIIVKPSELAPRSAEVIARIVRAALPEDEFLVVQGGADTAQALLKLPFNHIFYIGNNTVGRYVMKAAADHFASVTLEMGGKNPVIVDASADLDDAAKKIAWGRLSNAGQICIAPDYALVHESVAASFVAKLKVAMTAMFNPRGQGFEQSPEYPRIINQRHFERVRGLIEDARGKGAKVELGGEYRESDRYIAPTVLTQVSDEMQIMDDEVFGPVLAIVPFKSRDEVVQRVRSKPKPLALYVFAQDRAEVDFYVENTTSGSTVINHNVVQSGTNPHLPFGGVNHSGIGRIGGHDTFLECSNRRAIVEDGPALGDPDVYLPPYTDKYRKMMNQLLTGKPVPDAVVTVLSGIVKLRSVFAAK